MHLNYLNQSNLLGQTANSSRDFEVSGRAFSYGYFMLINENYLAGISAETFTNINDFFCFYSVPPGESQGSNLHYATAAPFPRFTSTHNMTF
jgi:hypothetical protein